MVAKEYHQAPHEVEDWPVAWFNRAVLEMRGRNIYETRKADKQQREMQRKGRR